MRSERLLISVEKFMQIWSDLFMKSPSGSKYTEKIYQGYCACKLMMMFFFISVTSSPGLSRKTAVRWFIVVVIVCLSFLSFSRVQSFLVFFPHAAFSLYGVD